MRDFVLGVYLAGTTILSGVARALRADRPGFEAVLERLSRGLARPGQGIAGVCAWYRRWVTQATPRGGFAVVAIDLSLPGHDQTIRMVTLAQAVAQDFVARPWVVHRDKLVRVDVRFGYVAVEVPQQACRRERKKLRVDARPSSSWTASPKTPPMAR